VGGEGKEPPSHEVRENDGGKRTVSSLNPTKEEKVVLF